jgi:Ca-activated chloride channel family protein
VVLGLVVAACGDGEPMSEEEARAELAELEDDLGWETRGPVGVPVPDPPDPRDVLPDIEGGDYPLTVQPSRGSDVVIAEVFTSTEKSGDGDNGWMVEVAEDFNRERVELDDGRTAQIAIRKIASGTGFDYIANDAYVPAGYAPSNQLWVEMASVTHDMREISPSLVENVAGIVMKDETAAALGSLDPEVLIKGVTTDQLVMGYTNPFASSTGLNFLLTTLDTFAEGDESQLLSPDVASVFEAFQRNVPFVALTTLQMQESVEKDDGLLDAFVMEWQTYTNTPNLRSGFEFVPFGVRHDNPLYATDAASPAQVEVLELFADFAAGSDAQQKARELGFDPPDYASTVDVPDGPTLIEAQQLWKERKDGGRPIYAVFVTDVSGSMSGTRIFAVQDALQAALGFINPEAHVGLVEFNDRVTKRLDVEEFDLSQQSKFAGAIREMSAGGGTAMYDGIVLGLSMLTDAKDSDPDAKLLLFVLTDGETTDGLTFGQTSRMIEGLGIPIYTVGFEADLDELQRLSSLVESASINADEDDVAYKLSALFQVGA